MDPDPNPDPCNFLKIYCFFTKQNFQTFCLVCFAYFMLKLDEFRNFLIFLFSIVQIWVLRVKKFFRCSFWLIFCPLNLFLWIRIILRILSIGIQDKYYIPWDSVLKYIYKHIEHPNFVQISNSTVVFISDLVLGDAGIFQEYLRYRENCRQRMAYVSFFSKYFLFDLLDSIILFILIGLFNQLLFFLIVLMFLSSIL